MKDALVESLDRAGVLALAAGGGRLELQRNRDNKPILPASLNANGDNMPLLAALISAAVAPGFAVRKSRALLRTQQDTVGGVAYQIPTLELMISNSQMAMVQSSSVVTLLGKEATNKSGQASEVRAVEPGFGASRLTDKIVSTGLCIHRSYEERVQGWATGS